MPSNLFSSSGFTDLYFKYTEDLKIHVSSTHFSDSLIFLILSARSWQYFFYLLCVCPLCILILLFPLLLCLHEPSFFICFPSQASPSHSHPTDYQIYTKHNVLQLPSSFIPPQVTTNCLYWQSGCSKQNPTPPHVFIFCHFYTCTLHLSCWNTHVFWKISVVWAFHFSFFLCIPDFYTVGFFSLFILFPKPSFAILKFIIILKALCAHRRDPQ